MSLEKPIRGAYALARRKNRRKVEADAEKEKRAAKARDSHRCRWPRADHPTPRRVCVGQLEAAHQVAIGMGGDRDGSRTTRAALLSVCTEIHLGPGGLERHRRRWVELEEGKGADGPIAFERLTDAGEWVEVARERWIGVLEC